MTSCDCCDGEVKSDCRRRSWLKLSDYDRLRIRAVLQKMTELKTAPCLPVGLISVDVTSPDPYRDCAKADDRPIGEANDALRDLYHATQNLRAAVTGTKPKLNPPCVDEKTFAGVAEAMRPMLAEIDLLLKRIERG